MLFTPAGMNQFKDHFLGKVKLEFTRATTCQKCLRTGDIDNVGRTAYHHTFFEMLGNFSFGDYFKRDAINWAWEFLTDKKWLGIDAGPADRDGLPRRRRGGRHLGEGHRAAGRTASSGCGEDENFWPASAPSQGPGRRLRPVQRDLLPSRRGQVGRDLEPGVHAVQSRRRAAEQPAAAAQSRTSTPAWAWSGRPPTLQGVPTNYHIDILLPLVQAAAEVCGMKYESESDNGRRLRRITDHVRACTFAVHENVYPGANKEKYVVKRLLRRAVLDGHQMGLREPFLHKLVPVVAEMMKRPYPELRETVKRVSGVIEKEEANFFGTIDAGLNRIDRVFDEMRRDNRVDGRRRAWRPSCIRRTACRRSCSSRWRPSTTWRSTGRATRRRWRSTAKSPARCSTR